MRWQYIKWIQHETVWKDVTDSHQHSEKALADAQGWRVGKLIYIYINTETLVLPIFEHLKPNAAGPDLRQQASKGKVWLMERVQFFVSMQSQAKCYF